MKKRVITISIISTILLAIIITLAVLFGAVFCLKHQNVVFVSDEDKAEILLQYNEITNEETIAQDIIKTAKLKANQSIFKQNIALATQNIEKAYPYIKVSKITAVSINTFEIRLKARYEMFCYKLAENKFLVLDEDLKVLKIEDTQKEGLIFIKSEKVKETLNKDNLFNVEEISKNFLNVSDSVEEGDFVGTEYYQNIFSNLYASIYKTVKLKDEEGNLNYVERGDIKNLIESVEFKLGYSYERMVLTLNYSCQNESYNFVLDIVKPNENLEHKINLCFSSLPTLIENGKQSGTLRYYYNENHEEVCEFFSPSLLP